MLRGKHTTQDEKIEMQRLKKSGKSIKEIAVIMCKSELTVKTHLSNPFVIKKGRKSPFIPPANKK